MDNISSVSIPCPYCGEAIELLLEADLLGEMVYDCEVCCHPWRLRVHAEAEGRRVEATTLDE